MESLGFSEIIELKKEIYKHLKLIKNQFDSHIENCHKDRNPEKILLIIVDVRLLSLTFESDPTIRNELENLIDSLQLDQVLQFWNNPQIIMLLCTVMNAISPILELLQRKSRIDDLLLDFLSIEFENLQKWSINLENVLTQTLPFIAYFKTDRAPLLDHANKISLDIISGNYEFENWLKSLRIACIEQKEIATTIRTNPFKNNIIDYAILWLFHEKEIGIVIKAIKEKLEKIEYTMKLDPGKMKSIPVFFDKWICMEIYLLSLYSYLAHKYEFFKQILPFSELMPSEFERLCYWIVSLNSSTWTDVHWLGAAGGERGKDIVAKCIKSNKHWIFQCKRVNQYGPSLFRKEFNKVLPEIQKYDAEGYLLFITRAASDKLRDLIREESQEKGIQIVIYDEVKIDLIVKQNKLLLNEFFYKY